MTTWHDYFETNDYKRALPDADWQYLHWWRVWAFSWKFLKFMRQPIFCELYGYLTAEKQICFFNREWLGLNLCCIAMARWLQSHTKIPAWVHPLPHPSRRSVCAPLKFPDCVVKVAFPACRHFGYSTLHINIAHFFLACRLTTLGGTICFDAYFTYARGWVVWFVTAS